MSPEPPPPSATPAPAGPTPPEPPPAGPRKPRSARHQFASTMLVLEAFVVLFAVLAASALRVAPPALVWGVGGALVLALLLVPGMGHDVPHELHETFADAIRRVADKAPAR